MFPNKLFSIYLFSSLFLPQAMAKAKDAFVNFADAAMPVKV
jgi:hypothetical protein